MGELVGDALGTYGFDEFLAVLGADVNTPCSVFFNIPESSLVGALADTEVEGEALSAVSRAVLISLVQEAFTAGGRVAPLLGTTGVVPSPQPATQLAAAKTPTAAELDPDRCEEVPFNTVVDQNLRGSTRRLTYGELRDHRAFYQALSGCAPPECHLPSSDQLAGLRGLLATGRVPYVDFAIWSPLGPRFAKFRRSETAVLVGGAFVTKTLDAPSSHEAWEESWALFAVAMISLGAASPGALATYLTGIKQLYKFFPANWKAISGIDLVVRTERWLRIREDAEGSQPPGFNPRAPWDFIIRTSAYGQGGMNDHWWNTSLILPLTVGAPLALEGLPSSTPAGAAQSQSSSSATRLPKRARREGAPRAPAGESCQNWNHRRGGCQNDGPCANGRPHRCETCGGSHRACDVHGGGRPTGHKRGTSGGKEKRKPNHKGTGKGDRNTDPDRT